MEAAENVLADCRERRSRTMAGTDLTIYRTMLTEKQFADRLVKLRTAIAAVKEKTGK